MESADELEGVAPSSPATLQSNKAGARRYLELAMAEMEKAVAGASSKAAGGLRARIQLIRQMLDTWDEPHQGALSPAQKLRKSRLAAGLTQEQAASRAGVSLSAYRNYELSYKSITEEAINKLARVPELGLSNHPSDELETLSPSRGSWWVAESFQPIKMLQELQMTLNGSCGSVEQSLMYLDHKSAADYIALSGAARYASSYRNLMPLDKAAASVLEQAGECSLDVIALGAGDGQQEVRVVQLLADAQDSPDIRLTLLDISQPLLSVAFQNAADAFDRRRGVAVFALQGNFHHVPRYTQLYYKPLASRRRRLLTMLGLTITNLEDELHFFRHSLQPFAAGDFLMLDFHEAAPKPWAKNEPVLQRPVPDAHQEFLGGPIWRYSRDVAEVSLRYELGTKTIVPGSYAIEANATVKTRSGETKRFTMFKFKRYDADLLAGELKAVGWERVGAFRYGNTLEEKAQIMLLRKRS